MTYVTVEVRGRVQVQIMKLILSGCHTAMAYWGQPGLAKWQSHSHSRFPGTETDLHSCTVTVRSPTAAVQTDCQLN